MPNALEGFSQELKAASADAWRQAHEDHPFVRALGDGSLSLKRFQYFMRQDYVFLIGYCRVLGMAVAKSPDLDSMGRWAKLLDETLNSEMALHRSFCADFGITEAQLVATKPGPATTAYVRHLVGVAEHGAIGEIAVSLLPCQWGYDEIGRRLSTKKAVRGGSFHARWIEGYCAPEYRAMTEWLRSFVDKPGADFSVKERSRMHDVFKTSIGHEVAFWEQAWNAK